jgi:hypothetical protein
MIASLILIALVLIGIICICGANYMADREATYRRARWKK